MRKQAVEQIVRRIVVDVIHLRCAELLRFRVGLGGINRLQLNARAGGGFGGALALFVGRLGSARNLRNADLQDGQQLLHHYPLLDDRFELVVNDIGRVNLLVNVTGDDALREFVNAAGLELQEHSYMVAGHFGLDLALAHLELVAKLVGLFVVNRRGKMAAQLVAALAAHGLHVDFPVRIAVDELKRRLENVGVEAACKSLVAADDHHQHPLLFADSKERMTQVAGLRIESIDAPRQRLQNAGDHLGVGTRGKRPLLRSAQLGRRDHLHGLGDLPRVFDATDAAPKIEYVCHNVSS